MSNIRRIDYGVLPEVQRMHKNGIAIDIDGMRQFSSKLHRLMEEEYANIKSIIPREALESFIAETVIDEDESAGPLFDKTDEEREQEARDSININSPEQLADLLFTHMGLGKNVKLQTTKGGKRISTGKKTLEALKTEHEIIAAILRYREYSKLRTTYAEKFPKIARWDQKTETWRIHCEFTLTRTETGRLACKNPNLMNIPQRTDLGSEMRSYFISAPGKVLLSVDLSQIELRVLAHESNDPSMIDIFQRDGDIHVETTLRANDLNWEKWRAMVTCICDCGHMPVDHHPDDDICLRCTCKKHSGKKKQSKLRGPAKCYHPDTEILTRMGWKKITALCPGEEIIQAVPGLDGKVGLEWVVPTEVFTSIHPSGKLLHLKNEGMDLRVTPDHRMLGWGNNKKFMTVMPNKMNQTPRYWANAGILESGSLVVEETLLRLAVALQADGTITPWKQIVWGFSKERKINRLNELLVKSGIPFNRTVVKNGMNPLVTTFHLKKEDSEQLISLLDKKQLPWRWIELTPDCRRIVLEEAAYWDSCIISKHYRYTSVPHQNVHVLQAIAAITGRKTRAVMDKLGTTSVINELSVRSRSTSKAGSLSILEYSYTDEVACLAVPSTWVLVRDGGIPVICGNTVNFGICVAEGQLVLTDHGLIPIENVTRLDKVWDGENFVTHEGVIFKGKKEVITYDGLTTTPEHLVWLQEYKSRIPMRVAASGFELAVTGKDTNPIHYDQGYAGYVRSGISFSVQNVYDIMNAGPDHRFTVNGHLVSNCYGLSALGLQQNLALMGIHWTEQQSQDFIDLWFSLYPNVKDYMERIYSSIRRYGCTWDMFGRVRLIPGINSVHTQIQAAALREGGNMGIQSAAQGILKTAMAQCEHDTQTMFREAGIYAEPLIQVHDEILSEVEEDNVQLVAAYYQEVMNNAVRLRVPLKSEATWGKRWEK